jgi:hypothetical protein
MSPVGLLDEQLHAHRRAVVLDLRGVSFMDSTGLSLVLRHAASRGAEFTVVDGPHAVSRLFDLTSAREFVNFVPGTWVPGARWSAGSRTNSSTSRSGPTWLSDTKPTTRRPESRSTSAMKRSRMACWKGVARLAHETVSLDLDQGLLDDAVDAAHHTREQLVLDQAGARMRGRAV